MIHCAINCQCTVHWCNCIFWQNPCMYCSARIFCTVVVFMYCSCLEKTDCWCVPVICFFFTQQYFCIGHITNPWATSVSCNASWYWPQGLLLMPIDNIHKSWATPSDIRPVSSASKSDFLTSSLLIPGQCNFRCSREELMKASPQRLKTETFG